MHITWDVINFFLATTALLNFFLGILVLANGVRQRLNLIYTGNVIAIIAWVMAMVFYRSAPQESALFWCTILYIAPTIVASSFLYFTYIFPSQQVTSLRFQQVLIISANIGIIIITVLPGFLIQEVNIRPGLEKEIIFTSQYIWYFLYISFLFSYGFLRLFHRYRNSKDIERRRIFFFLTGYAIAANLAFVTNLILPWFGFFSLNWLGQVLTVIMVGFTVYAIVMYQFMDTKLIATEFFISLLMAVTVINITQAKTSFELFARIIFFVITLVFAFLLIRSVLKEVRRREELEKITRQLASTTRRMQKANRELKKLDEAKSEFISIASHQLRTPLTAIKGYGSMLLDGDFGKIGGPKQRDAIERMVISNNRLISLVENLLNISRIESGRIKFNMQPMQIEKLAQEVCETLTNSAQKQKLYVKLEPPTKPLPAVNADEEKIRQVLTNFVDNAIKYTREGGVTVTVAEHDGAVRCCVIDTGMGISAEEQQDLFKKFSRGNAAFTVNTEGTGLGLYVAQMMIEGHNGKIWVESAGEGKGSSFCFELPVANQAASNPTPPPAPLPTAKKKI